MGRLYGCVRYVYVGWAVLETMLFGANFNGWASLVFVLKEDGLYADLCDPSTNNSTEQAAVWTWCSAQDKRLNLWYSIAASLRSIFGIIIGIHMFKFGTRSARLTGWIMFISGALMMAFADKEIPWLVLPALLMLSYGGNSIVLTNFRVSRVFPGAASTIITLLSGGIDFSGSTQLLLKLLHDSSMFSRQNFYITLAVAHFVMVLISTIFFLPEDKPYPQHISSQSGDDELSQKSLFRTQRHSLLSCICQCFPQSEKSSNERGQNKVGLVNQMMNVEAELTKYTSRQDVNKQQRYMCELVCAPLSVTANTCVGSENKTCAVEKCSSDGPTNENSSQIFSEYLGVSGVSVDQVQTDLYDQGGLERLNNINNIATISGTLHENNHSDARGKCVTVIDNGRTFNTHALQCETSEPIKVPADVHRQESGDAASDTFKVGGSSPNHHGLRLDVGPADACCFAVKPTEDTEDSVDEVREDEGEEDMFPTLKSCFTSAVYWLHVIWYTINLLWLVAFYGLMNFKLNRTFRGDSNKVSHFTNVQTYFMLGVMGVCWISGALYDWQASIFRSRKTAFQRRVLPGFLPLVGTSLMGVVVSAMWMIKTEVSFYIMFTCMVVYNTFVFGLCASFQMRVFPQRYFGILNGVLSLIAGGFSFLQYAITVWNGSYSDGALHAELFLTALIVVSFCHPLYIICKSFLPVGKSEATLDEQPA